MITDLKYYAKVYKNWLDQDTCNQIVTELQDADWQQHQYYTYATDQLDSPNGDRELNVTNLYSPTSANIMQRSWEVLRLYFTELEMSWYSGWKGFTQIRYNRYQNNQLMNKHADHINGIFDGEIKGVPTLSVLYLFNDEFEGGNLEMWNDEKIEMGAGDVIVFPSSFLYPHRVTPVTSGTRYSGVSWVY